MIEKFYTRAKAVNSLVCVGLDSDFEKLPERFRKSPEPQFEFNKFIVEETHEYAAAYKPNLAFYEARGAQGVLELEKTIGYLREHHPDIYTICDAKRGDIGNTNESYVAAIFDVMGFDALTLHPYLGREALLPFLSRREKDSFILCRTSNPGAGEFQDLKVNGEPLWRRVAESVSGAWNKNNNCGLVVGATYPQEMRDIRALAPEIIFLIPGVGAQGGDIHSVVKSGRTSDGKGLIINSARGIIFSESPKKTAQALRDEINSYR